MLDHWFVWLVVLLALAFDYINGFHDTANAIATSVSTRAISPKKAVMMTAVLNFVGALVSTGVAKTIGGDLVMSANLINAEVISAALLGAIIWNLVTWWYGIPSSSSHALIGGVIGAVMVAVGHEALNFNGIGKIFLSLVLSPIIAMILGYIIMHILLFLFGSFSPIALNDRFRNMQLLSATLMAFFPRFQRCAEGNGDYYLNLTQRRLYRYFRCTDLGKSSLCVRYGLRYGSRRLAYYQHHGY